MRTWSLIGITLFVFHQTATAQEQVGCPQMLEDAREAYEAGMVELVPELLNPCLESGLSGENLREAYKLVITAYLFDYLPDRADMLMDDFLEKFPDYEPSPGDPSEFVLLLEEHSQQEALRQAEEQQAEEGEEDVVAREEVEEEPVIPEEEPVRRREAPARKEVFGSIGFSLGGNLSFPGLIEKYSIGDPELDQGGFGLSVPGFQMGAVMNLRMGRSVDAVLGISYSRLRLNYTGEPFSFTSYTYRESENRLGIPLTLSVKFNPDDRVTAYLRFGVVTEYLFSASASATRSYTETGTAFLRDVELEKVDITGSRSPLQLMGTAGPGISFPFPRGRFFLESRFHFGILKTNDEEHRYDQQELTWLIYHVDSDFRVNYLTLSAGMVWNLQKPQNLQP